MNDKLYFVSDFDGVLADADMAIRYMYSVEFKCPLPPEIITWDGRGILHNAPDGWIEKAFNSNELWEYMTLKDGVFPILNKIKKSGYFDNMFICSIGRKNNIKNKCDFVEKHGLSTYFNDCLFMSTYSDTVSMNKDFLNYNILLLDDNQKNLTGVKYPVLYFDGSPKQWNKGYEGIAVNGWDEEMFDTFEAIVLHHEK